MQHQITAPGPLLTGEGTLREKGYATSLLLAYNRSAIKASPFRIKEWDYYLVLCDTHALALTLADNGYMGLVSISLMDFETPWQRTKSHILPFPMGKLGLPATSKHGDVSIARKGYELSFSHEKEGRRLRLRMENFADGQTIAGEVLLTGEPADSMVIATPFPGRPKAFYYNQKINCMAAAGAVTLGDRQYGFHQKTAMGTLDWGRGVWTYRNTWYWGSCSAYIDGVPFGLNLGYGFGDTAAATENMVFYAGKAHKLGAVVFHIPMKAGREDYLSPWDVTSDDGRLRLTFMPVLDRAARMNALILKSDQHQVFGRLNGQVILEDGRQLIMRDIMGFIEKVVNNW